MLHQVAISSALCTFFIKIMTEDSSTDDEILPRMVVDRPHTLLSPNEADENIHKKQWDKIITNISNIKVPLPYRIFRSFLFPLSIHSNHSNHQKNPLQQECTEPNNHGAETTESASGRCSSRVLGRRGRHCTAGLAWNWRDRRCWRVFWSFWCLW